MNTNSFSYLDAIAIALMLAFALTANYLDWYTKYSGFAMIPLMVFYFLGKYAQKKQGPKEA